MLLLKPVCEACNAPLPADSQHAMICSYECTFCINCVTHVLENVCPNCGGGFEKRPIRPKKNLLNDPSSSISNYKPIELTAFEKLKNLNKNIPPYHR